MSCQHNFIRINDITKPRGSTASQVSWSGQIPGASAGCILCGQVRYVYQDGDLRIVVKGGDGAIDETPRAA